MGDRTCLLDCVLESRAFQWLLSALAVCCAAYQHIFSVLGNILLKAMAVCLAWHTALTLMPFLCCMSYLVERTRDYTSLFFSGVVSSSVAWAPESFVHSYVRCLILLCNVVGCV